MLVGLRAIEALALLAALGLPINLVLLPQSAFARGRRCAATRIWLAPCTGLVVVAIVTSVFFVALQPIANSTGLLFALMPLEWLIVLAKWRSAGGNRRALIERIVRIVACRDQAFVCLGLALVLGSLLWPYFDDPRLVFWHYAGTDAYYYMRTAEYFSTHASLPVPQLGLYDGASGFVQYVLTNLHTAGIPERPGTFNLLAALASMLGLLPHETFAPLVLAGAGMYFLSLSVLGASLRMGPLVGTCFGLFGLGSPVTWMLTTETFLANLLAIPLLAVLLVLPSLDMSVGTAMYAGLVLAGVFWIFPDIGAAAVAISLPYLVVLVWRARRVGMVKRLCRALIVTLLTAITLIGPLIGPLVALAALRVTYVIPVSTPAQTSTGLIGPVAFSPLSSWSWIWPALNFGPIPPEPLQPQRVNFLAVFVSLVVLFMIGAVWRRRTDNLWCHALALIGLLAFGGLAGRFRGDYELFRAVALFAFVPLAVVFVAPTLVPLRWRGAGRFLCGLGAFAVLFDFARSDLTQVRFGYENYLTDYQYTIGDLKDRAAVEMASSNSSIVMATDTPSFTAFSNTLILFSSSHLAVPSAYYKLVFIEPSPDEQDRQYTSNLVLRNLRYEDIYSLDASSQKIDYASEDFEVLENDLIPFFDDDTFPTPAAFPTTMLKRINIESSRLLSQPTNVFFFSRSNRTVQVDIRSSEKQGATDILLAYDDAPSTRVTIGTGQRETMLPPLAAAVGLHKITLTPIGVNVAITRLALSDEYRT